MGAMFAAMAVSMAGATAYSRRKNKKFTSLPDDAIDIEVEILPEENLQLTETTTTDESQGNHRRVSDPIEQSPESTGLSSAPPSISPSY